MFRLGGICLENVVAVLKNTGGWEREADGGLDARSLGWMPQALTFFRTATTFSKQIPPKRNMQK
jgi:hypothetical protein